MVVDVNSEDGQLIRKLIPLITLPSAQFSNLCDGVSVEKIQDGVLFKKGDTDTNLVYLLSGEVSLQADGLIVENVTAASSAAKFALAHQIPRKIDAVAKGTVRFLRLDAALINTQFQPVYEEDNSYMVIEDPEDDPDDWMTSLLRSPIFQRLPPANLQKILMSLQTVQFNRGEIIVEQGEAGDYYYLIKSGQCLVTRKPSSNSKQIKLAQLGKGETFGEDALLSDTPRNVSVTATVDTVLYRLNKDQFVSLIKEPSLKFVNYNEMPELINRGAILLDVRSLDEYNAWHLDNAINTPFFTLRMQVKTLSREKPIIVICANGKVSEAAAFLLLRNKIKAYILRGGVESITPEMRITHQKNVYSPKSEAALFKIDDGVETLIEIAEGSYQESHSDISEHSVGQDSDNDKRLISENEALKQANAKLKNKCLKLTEDKENCEKELLQLQQQIGKLTQMLNSYKGSETTK
jgi:CRP-like cAMP-binding protein/rhodanese-related sulfurtransferase